MLVISIVFDDGEYLGGMVLTIHTIKDDLSSTVVDQILVIFATSAFHTDIYMNKEKITLSTPKIKGVVEFVTGKDILSLQHNTSLCIGNSVESASILSSIRTYQVTDPSMLDLEKKHTICLVSISLLNNLR